MAREFQQITVLNAKNTTGVGPSVRCAQHRHKELMLAVTGMGAGDTIQIQIQGSFEESCPDFSAAKSATNPWDYIQIIDLEDGAPIDGDSGVTFSNSNDVRQFSVNIDTLQWISLNVVILSDSNTTVTGKIYLFHD